MAEKNLSELEWKKFAKGRDLKDAALIKALAALEKAQAPAQALAALDDVEKQADTLRKSARGDKELAKYLDDLDKALDKERKSSEFEARKAASEAATDQGGDEDEETPALLTSRMIPLIRQVKKGEEMQALLASSGKEVAVMLSRRAISPSRRKLLSDYLDDGTPKFFPGTCLFEENAYTFVLKTQAAGLARKVKAALLKQVELRLKVRVRGEDPNDIDDDGEPAEAEGAEAQAVGTGGDKTRQPGNLPDAPPLPPDPLKGQYDERMAMLEPRVLAALKAQQGDVSKIRAVAEFASGKGEGGNYRVALSVLDSLEKLLPATQEGGGNASVKAESRKLAERTLGPDTTTAVADEGARFNARLAALMPRVKEVLEAAGPHAIDVKLKVSEAGMAARKKEFILGHALLDDAEKLLASDGVAVAPPLNRDQPHIEVPSKALADWKLHRSIAIASLKLVADKVEDARHASSSKAVIEIQAVIKNLTAEPSTRQQVIELQRWLSTDDVVEDVCELVDDMRTPLLASLQRLHDQLGA
jgi:hypothetical protein